ncbi:MAG: tetrahydromethanopterin S-methyltransferase subunit H family protein [Candidatus Bathyarchaeia archaeon]|jgi:tetrahydromethanopterin S-methyltransferase subunit H
MIAFTTKQTVACISGVNVGGQPGENPTCIIPSIFYDHHKIVSDPIKGEFDKQQAEALLNRAEELSEKTGCPLFVDVMATTADALIKYADFVSELVSGPFLVDSVSRDAKLQAVKRAKEAGLTEKIIYNSISFLSTPQELQALREFGVRSAVVLAFDPKNPSGNRETILSGIGDQPGLLAVAQGAGIENILVDTAVLQVPSLGVAGKAIFAVKERFGLPAGCAPANAVSIWKKLKEGEFGPEGRKVCLAASTLYTQMMGANFVIAGPIEYAEAVFPACAMADAIIAAEAQKMGIKISANHPLYDFLNHVGIYL